MDLSFENCGMSSVTSMSHQLSAVFPEKEFNVYCELTEYGRTQEIVVVDLSTNKRYRASQLREILAAIKSDEKAPYMDRKIKEMYGN